jgi:hypothetical protein
MNTYMCTYSRVCAGKRGGQNGSFYYILDLIYKYSARSIYTSRDVLMKNPKVQKQKKIIKTMWAKTLGNDKYPKKNEKMFKSKI